MRFFKTIFFIFLSFAIQNSANAYLYILNDKCINDLYTQADKDLKENEISVFRDSRGIILSLEIPLDKNGIYNFNSDFYKKIYIIKYFLAKIENPAIIEVHTKGFANNQVSNLRNWEVSTIIANNIETIIRGADKKSNRSKIKSVGYGEFLPTKNTPNNGGKYLNRVDIIILCNISGE